MAPATRRISELDVLAAIERGEVVTQMALTKRVGISIGLMNALLRRAIHKGYVKTRQVPYKRYAYYLTPKGFAEKSRLVDDYLDFSLQFFRRARGEYGELFAQARRRGLTRLVLVGDGELAEIAVLAAWGENITLVGIIDLQTNEWRRHGLNVFRSFAEVDNVDGVVITNTRAPQEAYEEMRSILAAEVVFAPPLLKITCDRAQLLDAQNQLGEP